MKNLILIVEDEKIMRITIEDLLRENGYQVKSLSSGIDAINELQTNVYDLVITDVRLPDINGIEVLKEAKKNDYTAVIVITAYANIKDAVEAMKIGAFDYIAKPFSMDELLLIVKKSLEFSELKEENIKLKADLTRSYSGQILIGESETMKNIFANIYKIANVDSSVLIQGESGTGKEVIATAIHYNSNRKDKPFVKINCAAYPESLLESELFGYEKGAFTGAFKSKPGRFEIAHKGTLFLDEIGDMPLSLQAKLLRFLQEKSFERLGGISSISVDVRIIAATNKNLQEEIHKGKFREDLFYRLNVIPIYLPPLRDRREDIPLFIEYMLGFYNSKFGKNVKLDKQVIKLLDEYEYPGNIRELQNIIERLVALSDKKQIITVNDLPKHIINNENESNLSLPSIIKDIEIDYIKKALRISHGNKSKAAMLLGISRKTLWQKLKEYKLFDEE